MNNSGVSDSGGNPSDFHVAHLTAPKLVASSSHEQQEEWGTEHTGDHTQGDFLRWCRDAGDHINPHHKHRAQYHGDGQQPAMQGAHHDAGQVGND